jgi:hypothetical protein
VRWASGDEEFGVLNCHLHGCCRRKTGWEREAREIDSVLSVASNFLLDGRIVEPQDDVVVQLG